MPPNPNKPLTRYTITDFKKRFIFEGTKLQCTDFLGLANSSFEAFINRPGKRCKGFYFINTKKITT